MHDQGELPPLKEGGDMAVLIGCVEKAREFNDEFLTAAIQEEKRKGHKQSASSNGKSSASRTGENGELPLKKTRIED